MTFRTVLTSTTTVLAFATGLFGSGLVPGLLSAPATAAETSSGTSALEQAPWVSNAKLKRVDAIELDAESLVFRDGSKTLAESSMRDSVTTVSLLNRLLGTPTRTQTAKGDGGACFPSGTTYTWGGAIRVAALSTTARAGNAVEIRVLDESVRARSGTDVELSGPDGVQVGDDIHHAIAEAPASERVAYGSGDAKAWQLILQEGWSPADEADLDGQDARDANDSDTDRGTNGVSAVTDDTTVTVLGSPMPVHAQRSC